MAQIGSAAWTRNAWRTAVAPLADAQGRLATVRAITMTTAASEARANTSSTAYIPANNVPLMCSDTLAAYPSRPGEYGGRYLLVKPREGKSWEQVSAGDGSRLLFNDILLANEPEVLSRFGIRATAAGIEVPDVAELNGRLARSGHALRFWTRPGLNRVKSEEFAMHAAQGEYPIASCGEYFFHDMSAHVGILLLPDRLVQLFSARMAIFTQMCRETRADLSEEGAFSSGRNQSGWDRFTAAVSSLIPNIYNSIYRSDTGDWTLVAKQLQEIFAVESCDEWLLSSSIWETSPHDPQLARYREELRQTCVTRTELLVIRRAIERQPMAHRPTAAAISRRVSPRLVARVVRLTHHNTWHRTAQ